MFFFHSTCYDVVILWQDRCLEIQIYNFFFFFFTERMEYIRSNMISITLNMDTHISYKLI